MRWGRAVAAVVVVVALAACGGGKKSNAIASGSASNANGLSAGADAPNAGENGSVGSDQTGAGDAAGPSGEVGGAQEGGKYRFQVTGDGAPKEIVGTIDDLSDTDQRSTTPGTGGQGDTIQTLRFLPDRIQLLSLEMKGPFAKTFNGPVMLAPMPATVGQTWAWDLTSTDNLTHVHQSSKVDRTETVVVGGQSVDTIVVETDITITGDINATGHLTSWASTVYKLSVRTHNVLHLTTPVKYDTDTTADLLDLRPS